MKRQTLRLLAIVWIGVAVLLRLYATKGGDASVVGGLLFLVWTAPFGPIWQFWISDPALSFWGNSAVQVIGDVFAIAAGAAFWFFTLPCLLRLQRGKTIRKM